MDWYSYQCGVIDCFNEMVKAGLKPLALAHPCDTPEQRAALLPFCGEICARYGNLYYPEDEMLITDLFPARMNAGKFNILFYRDPAVFEAYRQLKRDKQALVEGHLYRGAARHEIALRMGALLGYPREGCERLIRENAAPEPVSSPNQ